MRFQPLKGRQDLPFEPLYPLGVLCAGAATGKFYTALVCLLGKAQADRLDAQHVASMGSIVRRQATVRGRDSLQILDDRPAIEKRTVIGMDKRGHLAERVNRQHGFKILKHGQDAAFKRKPVMVQRHGDSPNERRVVLTNKDHFSAFSLNQRRAFEFGGGAVLELDILDAFGAHGDLLGRNTDLANVFGGLFEVLLQLSDPLVES